ncbi:MAG: DUF3795 domain-containing protein [Anaerolineales bacterium]|nr:DUF3795 domain-containing protein [Anaerolineales bacterium]
MDYSLDGYCGLYCGACPIFLETKAGTAKEACRGCKSGLNAEWCRVCNLKACARSKGVEFCSACEEYPCEKLKGFADMEEYPYHREIFEYMKTIDREGKAAWLEGMKARWSCPECGQEASWWDTACTRCGTALRGYSKPKP